MFEVSLYLLSRALEDYEERRDQEYAENRSRAHSEEERRTDGFAAGGAGARGEEHRKHTEDAGEGRHENGAETFARRGGGRLYQWQAVVLALFFGEFNDEDRVLRGKSDEEEDA